MKNTGITYTSAERSPVILPEMAVLVRGQIFVQVDFFHVKFSYC